jgi:hypothetical protein
LDAHIGQDSVERRGELAGPVSDEEPEVVDVIAEIYHEVVDLLGGLSPSRWVGRAQQVHRSVRHLHNEEHINPSERKLSSNMAR